MEKKIRIYIVSFCFIFISCGNHTTAEKGNINIDTLNGVKNCLVLLDKDTTIIYDLDDLSTEGVEAIARYTSGSIQNLDITIFGETGQAKICYIFYKESIDVSEKTYKYFVDIQNVKSDNDISLQSSVSYILDYRGKVLKGDTLRNSVSIFNNIQQNIPFILAIQSEKFKSE